MNINASIAAPRSMRTKSSRARQLAFLLLVSFGASSAKCWASSRVSTATAFGVLTMRPRSPRRRRRGREEYPHRSCAYRVRRVRRISPRVGGVAGASSKLTLEIVCVRLAINDGGLGSVADILFSAAASARGCQLDAKKIPKCKSESRRRGRVGSSALLLVGSDESGTSLEWAETSEIRELCR